MGGCGGGSLLLLWPAIPSALGDGGCGGEGESSRMSVLMMWDWDEFRGLPRPRKEPNMVVRKGGESFPASMMWPRLTASCFLGGWLGDVRKKEVVWAVDVVGGGEKDLREDELRSRVRKSGQGTKPSQLFLGSPPEWPSSRFSPCCRPTFVSLRRCFSIDIP